MHPSVLSTLHVSQGLQAHVIHVMRLLGYIASVKQGELSCAITGIASRFPHPPPMEIEQRKEIEQRGYSVPCAFA